MLKDQKIPQDALKSLRQKAWDQFEILGIPHAKHEAFRYLPLSKLLHAWPQPAVRQEFSRTEKKSNRIVFVNGFYEEGLSSFPDGVICQSFDRAMQSYGLFIQNHWAKLIREERDPFALVNAALHGKGVFLYIPPRVQASLEIHHVSTNGDLSSPRILISLGKGARLACMQTGNFAFGNSAIDCSLDSDALLEITDVVHSDHLLQTLRAQIKRGAKLKVFTFSEGGSCVRNAYRVQLLEEESSAELCGLSLLGGERQSHTHILMEHAAPNCHSRQHFKTVLRDKSRSSFEGKIYVHSIAQKTEAYQLCKSLLLSDTASANAKPNLEIFADDVKASHGATVSQLNDEELFYFRSRGLSPNAAKSLLVEGFCKEMIEKHSSGRVSMLNSLGEFLKNL